ncbi:MAG TPA: HU family DNA-binding protein [Rectinemataceae bacterium]|nr:HU family DNA-binding protein [Rectinemataceae bacterium]
MAKMTKSQLLTTLSEKSGLTKKDVAGVLDALSALAYKEVKKVGEFTLPGFGKMVKAKRKARTGVNPATGEKIKIAAKTVVKFRLAKAAKDAVL